MLAPQLRQQIIRWNPAKFTLHAHRTYTRRTLGTFTFHNGRLEEGKDPPGLRVILPQVVAVKIAVG